MEKGLFQRVRWEVLEMLGRVGSTELQAVYDRVIRLLGSGVRVIVAEVLAELLREQLVEITTRPLGKTPGPVVPFLQLAR